jgi:glutamate synthase (NADPH) large chain
VSMLEEIEADGLIFICGDDFSKKSIRRLRDDQLLGMTVAAQTLATAIPFALEHQLDFLVLDGTAGIGMLWAELQGAPDLTIWRDAITILRDLGKEEEIALLSFGDMRSGTDVAKATGIPLASGEVKREWF